MRRNSNIELLRIISMIMIIISHYTTHNGINNYVLPLGFNRFLLEFTTIGNIGVILFILITGYYCINKENPFNLKKLILLVFEVLFYSISIYFIFVFLKITPFEIKSLIKTIFPISFKVYWFITTYILLYIFIPYINIFLKSMAKKKHLNFCILCVFIFYLLATITTNNYYGNELVQFIIIYSIGAYIGRFREENQKYKKYNSYILIISFIIVTLSIIIFDLIGLKNSLFSMYSNYLMRSRNSIFTLLFSIGIFNIFINKTGNTNKIINIISANVLGVYLISDNYLIRKVLWADILKVGNYVNSPYLIIHMILSVILVFTTCIIIDFIRKQTIEKFNIKVYDKIYKRINSNHEKI